MKVYWLSHTQFKFIQNLVQSNKHLQIILTWYHSQCELWVYWKMLTNNKPVGDSDKAFDDLNTYEFIYSHKKNQNKMLERL